MGDGANRRAPPLDAALLNGTAGTWLELDEGNLFAKGHPGIQVVPAAVALAQDLGSSGPTCCSPSHWDMKYRRASTAPRRSGSRYIRTARTG